MQASENPGVDDTGASEIPTSRTDHTIPTAGTATDVVLNRPDIDALTADGWVVRDFQDAITRGSHAPFLVMSKRVPRVGESASKSTQRKSLRRKSAVKPQVSDRGHKRPWEGDRDPDPVGVCEALSRGSGVDSPAFGDLPTIRAAGTGQPTIPVSFDTEFVQTSDGRRVLVSYQLATPDPTDPSLMVLVVFLPLSLARLRLATALRVVWVEAGLQRHTLAVRRGVGVGGVAMASVCEPGDDDLDDPARARRNRLYRKHAVPINLRCHAGKADLTVFRRVPPDPMKNLTSAAGGLVTLDSFRVCATDDSRNYWFPFSVSVSDTMCHAPAGSKTLDALGAACGQPKVSLPEGVIERMDLYRRDHPVDFCRYSATDPVVVHEYLERLYGPDTLPPVTLSSGAANAFRQLVSSFWLCDDDDEFSLMFGGLVKRAPEATASEDDRSYYEKRGRIPVNGAARAVIDACANGYHGGLNMCPMPGYYPDVQTFDFDLCGAYPTAMSAVPDVDWAHPNGVIEEVVTNRELTLDDVPDPMSPFVGWVAFEFPDTVAFPALPIFADGCPMYVRTSAGTPGAQVMAPEVHLALKLGARVHCQLGYKLRRLAIGGEQSFALRVGVMQMVKDRALARKRFGRRSLEELAIKTMANSTYGKTAQDVAQQNAWDAYEQKMDSVGGSAITSPYHAAMTTSFVRAELIAAANQLDALGRRFFSVTTDGFISDAELATVVALDLYGLAAVAADARALIADGDRSIWETKHQQSSLLNITTRGNVALNDDGVLAKNGYKTPMAVIKSGRERQHFFDLVVSRTRRIPNPVKVWPSFRELSRKENRLDFIVHVYDRALAMDFDCKRQPDMAGMVDVPAVDSGGVEHVVASFTTTPWDSLGECIRGREVAKNHADAGGALRTVADWREWELRRAHGAGRRIADPRRSILLSIVIGHRQGVLGFDVPALATAAGTVSERLDWLSGWGLGTAKESDWKNARRPDRLGQMLAPSACEPYLSVIRSAAPGTTPRDLVAEVSSGGDPVAERAS